MSPPRDQDARDLDEAAEPDDLALLRAHVDGDPEAFGVLFRRHRDRLWAVALRTTGNAEDAADGLQDALVAAYRRAGSFRGDAAVTTWLHRVVVNACLDRLRAARSRRAEPLPDRLDEAVPTLPAGPATTVQDPADRVVADERRRAVLEALASLPPEQRAALVLVDMEGYPVAEVALVLGCAVGTVKSRCARGRARLAVLLELHDPRAGRPSSGRGNPPVDPTVGSTDAPRGPPAASV